MTGRSILSVTAVALLTATAVAIAVPAAKPDSHRMLNDADLKWAPAVGLPPGTEMAVLSGDLAAAGPFAFRARMPAGLKVAPHWHPADENLTVLSGSLWMGMGEAMDEKAAHELKAGGFALMPQGVRHFAFTRTATVIQVHGIGPWGITYVNPADDPRNPAGASKKN